MLPGGGRRFLAALLFLEDQEGSPGPRAQALAGEGVRRKRGGGKRSKKEEEEDEEEKGGDRGLFLTFPGGR